MNTSSSCPICGTAASGYKYCLNCGHRLDSASAPRAAKSPEATRAEPPEVSVGAPAPEQVGGPATPSDDTAEVPLLGVDTLPGTESVTVDPPSYARPAAADPTPDPLSSPPGITGPGISGPGISGPGISKPSLLPPGGLSGLTKPISSAMTGLRTGTTNALHNSAVGGRSAPFVIGLLALVVVVLLVLAAGLVVLLSDDDPPAAKKAASSSSAEPGDATQVTCWNDSRVRRIARCPALTGAAAMDWVFPSLDRKLCQATREPGTRTAWKCRMRSPAGYSQVLYVEFDNVDSMRTWVRSSTRGVPRGLVRSERADPERWVWRERRSGRDGRWATTTSYVGERWAARVVAKSKGARNDAYSAIEFRPLRWLHGIPDVDRT